MSVKTISIPFPLPDKGKLGEVFSKAEKWAEIDEDELGRIVAMRVFVRHPRYPKCTALIESTITKWEGVPGLWKGTGKEKRTITDNGLTPANAIRELARYSQIVRGKIQQRHIGGRPLGQSQKTRKELLELAEDYYETQKEYSDMDAQPLTQEEFCEDHDISVSKLQRALRMACESKQSKK